MKNQFTIFEASFLTKLSTIDVASISEDKRVTDYLKYLLQHKKYFLKIYSFALNEAVKNSTKQINELTILDFGTGNGLLALYAKHCGFKLVYASDIYSNFIASAKKLSQSINIEVDEWMVCNEFDLFNNFSTKQIDIIVGTDVIEHVYDLDIFFANIYELNKNIISAFTTASVDDNYFKRKKLEQLMLKDELEFVEIRKNIIQQHDSSFDEKQLEILSKATRGLIKNDIITYVDDYKKSELLQPININKYNTCDPLTGSFTERILTIEEYKKIYHQHQFKLNIISGFYNDEGNILKTILIKLINFSINCFNKKYFSRTIAPFILLIGFSRNNQYAD